MTAPDKADGQSPALAYRGVSYSFGSRQALDGVSFDVPRGGVTLLLGPNGAGKTTLLSLACRLLALQSGDIVLEGASLRKSGPEALRPLGLVFQQTTLDLDLTVRQNLRYFASLHGLPRNAADAKITAELERVSLIDRLDDPVRALNGGHRRRLEIARALMADPDVLLLDEPTSGLDQPTRTRLVDYLHDLAKARGLALLVATHLFDEAKSEDRVVIIDRGRVRAAGPQAEILAVAGAGSLCEAFDALTGAPVGAKE